jgi:hypothetical protein
LRRICVTGDLRSERRLFENREIRLTDLRHLRVLCLKEREVRDFGRVGAGGRLVERAGMRPQGG